ncbi:non-hydrolyzing UDP-N-acetylglucosamine 2-epimerase [Inmirania thermothiophila]|uniref:non-hydrolyzing UDP-N-acetylglucosamine 2-epimerase n=1 Tax=Inmirania thermothiophila TaxID=1750597 RepID=UPI00248311DE|nr:UDP-N-acetylglucosamine 2-epimerase (non-hydrolyzing) [Inmirania thermothiophila]
MLCVVGARPNFMKIAPVMRALREAPEPVRVRLVHTGQHYDEAMKDAFFRQLGLPEPDVDLGVGSASHAVQTAQIMERFEPVLEREDPACVVVVGDVNSTLACALVAAKAGRAVAHVEAGLRSFDRTMPEEVNRVLTDQVADLLFCTEPRAVENLRGEGIEEGRIHLVGNVMIDTLLRHRELAVPPARTLARHGVDPAVIEGAEGYILLTLHRPANVDDPAVLRRLIKTVRGISDAVPVVFPVHPRTAARIEAAGLGDLMGARRIVRLPPLGYLETLGLMAEARLVMTDSGGMQEETTALGVPCITLRENTERPITVEQGTNRIVGSDPNRILAAVDHVLANGAQGRVPQLWDGRAAERIRDVLVSWLNGRAG